MINFYKFHTGRLDKCEYEEPITLIQSLEWLDSDRGPKCNKVLHIIKRHPHYAYKFARDVIGGRWYEAEPTILKDSFYTFQYIKNIIKDRWLEAEPALMKQPDYAYMYANYIIKGRWPEAEPYIMKEAFAVFYYAKVVIKGRWVEAEDVIREDETYWEDYCKMFKMWGDYYRIFGL